MKTSTQTNTMETKYVDATDCVQAINLVAQLSSTKEKSNAVDYFLNNPHVSEDNKKGFRTLLELNRKSSTPVGFSAKVANRAIETNLDKDLERESVKTDIDAVSQLVKNYTKDGKRFSLTLVETVNLISNISDKDLNTVCDCIGRKFKLGLSSKIIDEMLEK